MGEFGPSILAFYGLELHGLEFYSLGFYIEMFGQGVGSVSRDRSIACSFFCGTFVALLRAGLLNPESLVEGDAEKAAWARKAGNLVSSVIRFLRPRL